MIAYNDPLWHSLQALQLDAADAELSFTQRLARENGWHHAYAEQVVVEYRKFLWMAMRAGHPVTPSDEVDQAWHLHLVYTESYWHDLCRDVLGKPLHHGPTKGGGREDEKFHGWYERTLATYEASFGAPPPPAVWPPSRVRFGRAGGFRRVNVGEHWVISKNHWQPRLQKAAALIGAAMAAGLLVQAFAEPRKPEATLSADAVWIFVAFLVIIVLYTVFKNRNDRGGSSGNGCSGTFSGCGGGSDSSGNHSGCSSGHHGGNGGSSGCSSGSGCGGGGCGGGGGGD